MKITEALVLEHATYRTVFDYIELVLPGLRTLAEIKLLGGLVAALLYRHGEAEDNLVYVALAHTLEHRGQLGTIHLEHQEVTNRLQRVQMASSVGQGRRLLAGALLAARRHFEREEQAVFPLVEQVLACATLTDLGEAFLRAQPVAVWPA